MQNRQGNQNMVESGNKGAIGTGPTILSRRTIAALTLAALTAGALPVSAQSTSGKTPKFETDILPVLLARCVKCHGEGKPKANLDLRSRAGILKGGESGSALVPGSADKSLLFEMIHKGEMPPGKAEKLTAA